MSAIVRWLLALAAAIVVAGVVGVAVHSSPSHRVTAGRTPATSRPSTTVAHRRSTTTTAHGGTSAGSGPPGPSSATLEAGLLIPNDLGGYFLVEPSEGAAFLASAPCLAGLGPASSQSGRAVTGLVDSTYGSLPEIVEVVTSYPGAGDVGVYRALVTTLGACRNFTVSVRGSSITVPLAAGQMPQLGEASSLYQGQFTQAGRTEQLGIALAADNNEVVMVAYVDTQPPTTTFFGGVQATLSAAIGKEA